MKIEKIKDEIRQQAELLEELSKELYYALESDQYNTEESFKNIDRRSREASVVLKVIRDYAYDGLCQIKMEGK